MGQKHLDILLGDLNYSYEQVKALIKTALVKKGPIVNYKMLF